MADGMTLEVGDSNDPAPLMPGVPVFQVEGAGMPLPPTMRHWVAVQIELSETHRGAIRRLVESGKHTWPEARQHVMRWRIEMGWAPRRRTVSDGSMAMMLDVAARVQQRSVAAWRAKA